MSTYKTHGSQSSFLIHLIFCFPVSSSSEITLKPDDQKAYATNSFFSCVKEKGLSRKTVNSDQIFPIAPLLHILKCFKN